MYTPRSRPILSLVAALFAASLLNFATVAPVNAGTGDARCHGAEVNSSLNPVLA